MCFFGASFLCGLCFPIHPFIMELLSHLKIAPGQLVLNTWQIIISCMLIWMFVNEGDMIRLNEFLYLNRLKLSTHYGYYELCWVIGNLGLLTISPLIFMTGIWGTSLFLGLVGKPFLMRFGVRFPSCGANGRFPRLVHVFPTLDLLSSLYFHVIASNLPSCSFDLSKARLFLGDRRFWRACWPAIFVRLISWSWATCFCPSVTYYY